MDKSLSPTRIQEARCPSAILPPQDSRKEVKTWLNEGIQVEKVETVKGGVKPDRGAELEQTNI